jgi:hypothetical protein
VVSLACNRIYVEFLRNSKRRLPKGRKTLNRKLGQRSGESVRQYGYPCISRIAPLLLQEWPTNAIVCASSPTRELSRGPLTETAYREGGPIGHHFGLALEFPDFTPVSLPELFFLFLFLHFHSIAFLLAFARKFQRWSSLSCT